MKLMPICLAGLATLAAGTAVTTTAAAQSWRGGQVVTLTMTDHGFVPGRVTLAAGKSYTLRFRNLSTKGHNFTARDFWKLARVSPADQSWVAKNQLSLEAGQRAVVHIVAPTTPGARYAFRSTVLADAGDKFRGNIFVR